MLFHAKLSPSDEKTSRLFMMFLLIVDKAAREYIAGHDSLTAYINSTNKTDFLIDGLGRYETCVVTLKRAYKLLDRLKNQQDSPVFNRQLRKLIETWEKPVTDVRNAIEHMDEKILKNELANGEAHLLSVDVTGNFLELTKYKISFTTVYNAVKNLHLAGIDMIEKLPVS